MDLQRAEVGYLPVVVIGTKNNVDIPSRLVVGIFQPDFRKRRPLRFFRKEKPGGVLSNDPLLPEADRAGDYNVFPIKDTAYAKRVVRLVFRAVWNLVVEWTKAMLAVTLRLITVVGDRESEYFRKGLLRHAREGSRSTVSGQAVRALYG